MCVLMKWCSLYTRTLFVTAFFDDEESFQKNRELLSHTYKFWIVAPEDLFASLIAYSDSPSDDDGNIAGLVADWLSDNADFLREMNKDFPLAQEIIPHMHRIYMNIFHCGGSIHLPELPDVKLH